MFSPVELYPSFSVFVKYYVVGVGFFFKVGVYYGVPVAWK